PDDKKNLYKQKALIDSGADISCVPNQMGADLGFQIFDQEVALKALSVGGEFDYLVRQCSIKIDEYKIRIPVAWVQDERHMELIVGRAVVFDNFDITFKQADEIIEFHRRS
ncbi:MAG: hypothetical protein GY859_27595, partial [Desulfobacterales bacterium]|nr:hypothetical protein [Desulfobacterales bacterium]